MNFLYLLLGNLRKQIPYLIAGIGMTVAWAYMNYILLTEGSEFFDEYFKILIGVAGIIGYFIGFFIKKIIPDPHNKIK